MTQTVGPRTSDAAFFFSLIDASRPGLDAVQAAAAAGDFGLARKLFAAEVRRTLQPERFLSIPHTYSQHNAITFEGEDWRAAADRVCKNLLISCSTPFDFGETIDYFSNPTFNQYKEWTWQLSRHNEWPILAYAYTRTNDEKYAEAFARQFGMWVRQALSPEPGSAGHGDTKCWRTIEAGIRMGSNWQYALHVFYNSPAFTDDLLTDWFKSVWEHGERLSNDYSTCNWLLMEMDGLAQIGLLYPQLREAPRWLSFALDMMGRELSQQFYPDGMHYELSTGYHGVSVSCYTRLMKVMRAYDVPIPSNISEKLENTVAFYGKLIMPDFRLPDINDGTWEKAGRYVSEYKELFPHRADFEWLSAEGNAGHPPDYLSIALPWSGMTAMRTGWHKDALWGFIDAAPFGQGHQHEDKLSVLLYMNGRRVLTEGGNYAYDSSEMRRYVQSTRSHNTVRVGGMDQNRRKEYRRENIDIDKKADMRVSLTKEYDFASGVYDEGYGPDAERAASHERALVLVKKPPFGSAPFFIVIDRLRADKLNQYEFLWHMDADGLTLDPSTLRASSRQVDVLVSHTASMTASIVSGQESPEWQGWGTKTGRQGDFAPQPTLRYIVDAADTRVITVFCPAGDCPISSVDASSDPAATEIIFRLRDGQIVALDEKHW